MTKTNHKWILKRRPAAVVGAGDLEFVDSPVPELEDGELLVRNLFLSLDPTNRLWMSEREQYLPPVTLGEVMRGGTIGVVEQSRSPRFAEGDLVLPAGGGWQLYTVAQAAATGRVKPIEGIPLTAHLSVLGATGLTAYFGLLDICKPVAGETIVISAAAGAVGSVAGQIAKLKGCRVVGIAGGAKKCSWLVDELNFDAAIDYKAEDVSAALRRHCPHGIDMNFENVGGPIMDAVFSQLNLNGRMALCGMISGYNNEAVMAGPTDFGRVLMQRLTIKGFIVLDYLPRAREALADLSAWAGDGCIKWKDHVIESLAEAPQALSRLFSGNHDGKLMVRVSDLSRGGAN